MTPHICGFAHHNTTDEGLLFTYEVSNNGIGPARITKFILLRNDQEIPKIEGEVFDYINSTIKAHLSGKANFIIKHSFGFGKDASMRAGETRRMVEILFPGVKQGQQEGIQKNLQGLEMRIEYESFYGQKFTFNSGVKEKL